MLKAIVLNLDDVDEKYHELYEERDGSYHLKRIEGLVTAADVTRVQTALSAEKLAHKDTRKKFQPLIEFGELADVIETLQRVPELEAAAIAGGGKVDQAKIDQLVESRLKQKLAPVERERDQLRTQVTEQGITIEGFNTERRVRAVGDTVRAAATKLKVRAEAFEDIQLQAERLFDVSEDNEVVAKDKVGITPGLSVEVWLGDMQSKKPHWWGDSIGSGAQGSGRGGASGSNPWKLASWNMTEQMKIVKADPKKAAQMAAAAGTRIGGPKPTK